MKNLLFLITLFIIGCSSDDKKIDNLRGLGLDKVTKDEEPGRFKHGGFVVYEKNGHGLVAATEDLGRMDWESAKTACKNLVLNGYDDWYLPSKGELNQLYVNLKQLGVGGFAWEDYWSSTEDYYGITAWSQYFSSGRQSHYYKDNEYDVRAVRAF